MGEINVEVAYARADVQRIYALHVPTGTTLVQAVVQSGVLTEFPEIDLEKNRVGIFARLAQLNDVLRDGDRVEIYRALIADPKEIRRQRAEQGKTMNKGKLPK